MDVSKVDLTAVTYRAAASRDSYAAAATAEGRKVLKYKSKVDRQTTDLIPAAFEISGRWGVGLISFFIKKGVKLATRKGRTWMETLLTKYKRRLSI